MVPTKCGRFLDRSPRGRRRDSPGEPADVEQRVAAAQPGADAQPPAAAAAPAAPAAAAAARGRRRRRAGAVETEAAGGRVAADGEAGLGAVVVRGRLPGERHLQQDGTGKVGCSTCTNKGWNHFEGRGSAGNKEQWKENGCRLCGIVH